MTSQRPIPIYLFIYSRFFFLSPSTNNDIDNHPRKFTAYIQGLDFYFDFDDAAAFLGRFNQRKRCPNDHASDGREERKKSIRKCVH